MFQFGFSMASVWFQLGFIVVSVWFQYGFSLVSLWFQFGFSLASVWFQFGYTHISSLHLKGIVHAINGEASLVDEMVDSWVTFELKLARHVGVLSTQQPIEDVVISLNARKLIRHTRLLQQI